MPRAYSVSFENITVAAAQDLFAITPADDKPVKIAALSLSQSTDVGDAKAGFMRISVIRGHTTTGSGGSAPTPIPVDSSAETAAGFTARVNDTTIASSGTTTVLHSGAWNIQSGDNPIWLPEGFQWGVSQANTILVVRLLAAPTGDGSIALSGTLYLTESG